MEATRKKQDALQRTGDQGAFDVSVARKHCPRELSAAKPQSRRGRGRRGGGMGGEPPPSQEVPREYTSLEKSRELDVETRRHRVCGERREGETLESSYEICQGFSCQERTW